MDDLKQLWLVTIQPEDLEEVSNNILMKKDGFQVKQLGHLIDSDSTNHYRPNAEHIDIMKEVMKEIKTITSDDLKNAKTLYRFPNLNLSRDKVKILQEKFDLKVKRDFHDADYGIVSTKYFGKLFVHQYLKKTDVADVRAWANTYKDCMLDGVEDTINARLDMIPEGAYVCIQCDWFSTYRYENATNKDRYFNMAEIVRGKSSANYHYYIESLKIIGNNLAEKYFITNPYIDTGNALWATLILIFFGAIAGYLPARRAANIKPIIALRNN